VNLEFLLKFTHLPDQEETLDKQDCLDCLDLPDWLENQVSLAQGEHVATKVVKVGLVTMVHLAPLVRQAPLDYQVRWVYQVELAYRVIRDRMVRRDWLVDMQDSTLPNTVRQRRYRCVRLVLS
jgi:hypothetical protein